jgi:hypothetical protein
MLLVLGLGFVVAGALVRREANIETDLATLGVVALIAVGFFAAILGLYGILREQPPQDARTAARQTALGRAAWRATLPPMVAGALMVGFFWLTDRWDNLSNPVQSQIALFAGVGGALVGALADRITRWELIIIPTALLLALLLWGDELPIDSEAMSSGEIVTFLVIAVLIIGVAINIPQVSRGRRATQST